MSTATMTNRHQTTPLSLGRASATRLAPSQQRRWLEVTAGRVWLTRSGAGLQGDDVWLAAGERHPLPAGTEWVAEGWPEAQARLIGESASAGGSRPASLWRAAWPKLRLI